MKRTVSVNISGRYFHIDEEAYTVLEEYLNALKNHFSKEEGGEDVIQDVETRICELFIEKMGGTQQVVSINEVEFVKERLGSVKDFGVDEEGPTVEGEKETFFEAEVVDEARERVKYKKSVYRDSDSRVIGGVCAGLSHYFGIDKLFIRLVFVVLTVAGIGFTIPVYLILWAIIPKARSTSEKLHMKGEKINIDNIERKVREEMGKMKSKVEDFANDKKKQARMKNNFYSMVSEVEPHAKKVGSGLRKVFGLLLLMGSSFWMIVAFGVFLEVPLVMELILEKNWEWVRQAMLFGEELQNHSSAFTIGNLGVIGFVFAPLLFVFVHGAKMFFDLNYRTGTLSGLLVAAWFVSVLFLIMAGSLIGIHLIAW